MNSNSNLSRRSADANHIHMINNGVPAFTLSFEDAFEEQAITYARILCLKNNGNHNGTLLVTCDQHSWVNNEQVWPIYRSVDGGNSWEHISDVTDTIFGTNRKAQPMLFELPNDIGNLTKGTLLLSGNLVPYDNSSSRIVVYKSTDLGYTWEYVSTVDTGGPFIYDPSPESTTTTVWEPFLYIDKFDRLVCAYSDERQKDAGILQALSLRYSEDGVNWSELINIAAIPNRNDRPGMFTVCRLPNGRFIASYEVVNRPSLQQNSSVVYYKFSDDGIEWNPEDIGILARTADGLMLGSSPYIIWVDDGEPNGTVVIGSKWGVNQNGDIFEGGQNFFVNYNLGEAIWQRLPQPLTWDAVDIQYLDAFSQSLETNIDNTILLQAANIVNVEKTGIDLRVGAMPMPMTIYEMENAVLTDVTVQDRNDASNGREVGFINFETSDIHFTNINVFTSGTYTVFIRYNNGTGALSSHKITVNNDAPIFVEYPPTIDWNRYLWSAITCQLHAGVNSLHINFAGTFAELDCLAFAAPMLDYVRHEEADRFRYSIDWTTHGDNINHFSNGRCMETRKDGATFEFAFDGTAFRIISYRGVSQNTFDVYIDGEFIVNVDTYGPNFEFKAVVYENDTLIDDFHTVKLVAHTIDSNTRYRVSVDAIEVKGTLLNIWNQ